MSQTIIDFGKENIWKKNKFKELKFESFCKIRMAIFIIYVEFDFFQLSSIICKMYVIIQWSSRGKPVNMDNLMNPTGKDFEPEESAILALIKERE